MQSQIVEHHHDAVRCQSILYYDESRQGPQPTVFLVHAFDGITPFIHDYAQRIVDAGYAAFCIDMFGEGETGADMDSCMGLIMPFFNDRQLLQDRVLAGFEVCQNHAVVDADRMVAMGFCFGGMCVLDLARAGADVKAVVSLHGVLMPPENVTTGDFKAKVLILHGYDDPQVTSEQLPIIATELTDKKIDWQFVYFGHTQHSFTDPDASDIGGPESGRIYNADSARRAWDYCQLLFNEVI